MEHPVLATINVETWQAVGALSAIVGGQALKFFQEFIKDRRERESEKQRLEVLKQMLGNLIHLNEETSKQNEKLERVIAVDQSHHGELLRALAANCKVKST